MIKKLLAMLLTISIMLPFTSIVTGQDNIVSNGTFDSNLNNWNTATSTNFSIDTNAGVCVFNTTHTDHMFDTDTNLSDGTEYNMTERSGDITGLGFNTYYQFNNETTNLLTETFDNYSYNGWEYTEYGEINHQFTQRNISTDYSLSSPTSMSIQSHKMQNITFFETDFSEDPEFNTNGFGDEKFFWDEGNERMDCSWSRNYISSYPTSSVFADASTHSYNFTDLNSFGVNITLKINASWTPQSYSYYTLAFFNASDLNHQQNCLITNVRADGFTHVVNNRLYGSDGNSSSKTGNGNTGGFNTNDLIYGINLIMWYNGETRSLYSLMQNRTTFEQYGIFSSTHYESREFHVDSVGFVSAEGLSSGTPQNSTAKGYVTEMKAWVDTFGLDPYGVTTGFKNITLPSGDSKLVIETNNLHYHDAQHGIVSSSIICETNDIKYSVYNRTTTSTTTWQNSERVIRGATTYLNMSYWNRMSLTEGSTSFPAKAVYYDNIIVDSIKYSWNSTYTSKILDRGYYSDWFDLNLIFGFNLLLNGNYNVVGYTRSGNSPSIDYTWSGWQDANLIDNGFSFIGGLYHSWNGTIASHNGRYIQYMIEIESYDQSIDSINYVGAEITSVPVNISTEWGVISQTISKPYTNYTTLKFDYKLETLENVHNGSINVWFGDNKVFQHDYDYFTDIWQSEEINLPDICNNSGDYNLRFQSYNNFNSTNGSATVLFDNIQVLIEDQAPHITSFNVFNETNIRFNGTFVDLTRGSDFDYLGIDGIESITIQINGTILTINEYSYIGNGTFTFEHTWKNTPFMITEDVIKDATLNVIDTTHLGDSETRSLEYPTAIGFITAILSAGLFVIIVVLILQRHLMTNWDTNKRTKDEGIMPNIITKKGEW